MSLPTVFYLSTSSMSTLSEGIVGKRKRGGTKKTKSIPKGDILIDSAKNEWIILNSIARGGFGEIYTASKSTSAKQDNFIIKIVRC